MTIRKNDEFEAIYPTLNLNGLTFLDIVDRIEREVVKKSTQLITQGSLNNCRGTWYELAGSPALMVISLAYLNNWREAEII